ncbi:MAG: TlyA family RNA methyltransferase [Dehalococcoidales bacterium]|nr:TlyA family RNA methyltransferase [Dehalococcoidales bacterium]
MGKARLDVALVEKGLAENRSKAQALILAGSVLVNGQPADKPGTMVQDDAQIEVRPAPPYVSRGGVKLQRALDHFNLVVSGLVVIDVGASTGGFTDLLLKRGAGRVYAIDVGYGQLDWRLRNDPRVVVMERTNIRYLESLPEVADAATVDVSFISLAVVLPAVIRLIKPDGWIVALVKPQFEAGREQVGKGGVVRDPEVHRQVLEKLVDWAQINEIKVLGLTPSPIKGPAGNKEFLLLLSKVGKEIDVDRAVKEAVL